ncbi:MAG: hypothetical protein ACUVXB_17835 [Bryobacteraceae bacterium]
MPVTYELDAIIWGCAVGAIFLRIGRIVRLQDERMLGEHVAAELQALDRYPLGVLCVSVAMLIETILLFACEMFLTGILMTALLVTALVRHGRRALPWLRRYVAVDDAEAAAMRRELFASLDIRAWRKLVAQAYDRGPRARVGLPPRPSVVREVAIWVAVIASACVAAPYTRGAIVRILGGSQ